MMTGFIGVRPTANTQAPNVSLGSIQSGITNAGKLFGAGALGLADELKQRRDADRVASVAGALASLGLNKDSVEGNYRDGMNKLIMAGATPQEALGLMKERVSPMLSDIGIGQKNRELDQSNKALGLQELGLMAKTATQPKTGYTKSFDVKTGAYSKPVFEGLTPEQLRRSSGDSISKDIAIKEVTYKDADGNTIKETVPVSKITGNVMVKDENGNIVDSGKPAQSFERQPLSQADRDSALALKNAYTNIKDIERMYSPDIVGPVDNFVSFGLNSAGINNERATRNRELLQTTQNLKANLTDALIKGVPSDRDLKMIEDMLPKPSESEFTFRKKLKNIESILLKQAKNSRAIQENRGASKEFDINDKELVSRSGKPVFKMNGKYYYKGQ